MPTTPRDLRRRIEDLQDDVTAQYGRTPYCEVAHAEFEIPQTPLPDDDRESIIDQFRHMGIVLPDDSIKLTMEHRDFHDALRRVVLGLQADVGNDATQLLCAGLIIGRRIGMADAAAAMKGFEVD